MPIAACHHRDNSLSKTLGQPELLGHICDESTIRNIGAAYRNRTPDEAQQDKLISLLLTDGRSDHDKPKPTTDNGRLVSQLNTAVRNDYATGKILTIHGWVLSLTEARQCALYSFNL
jgi:hypothetical protein